MRILDECRVTRTVISKHWCPIRRSILYQLSLFIAALEAVSILLIAALYGSARGVGLFTHSMMLAIMLGYAWLMNRRKQQHPWWALAGLYALSLDIIVSATIVGRQIPASEVSTSNYLDYCLTAVTIELIAAYALFCIIVTRPNSWFAKKTSS